MMGHIQQLFENDLAKDVRPFHFATGVTTPIYQLAGPLRQPRKRYPKFSAQHSGSGRLQWCKHLNLLRICQLIPTREILVTWFTIGLLREL